MQAVTDLGTSTYQLSTGMEPNNSVMAGLKLECVAAEDPQGNCAYTDDARSEYHHVFLWLPHSYHTPKPVVYLTISPVFTT